MLLVSVVAATGRGQNVDIEDLSYRNGKLTINASVRDFNAVDQLSKKFDQDPRVAAQLASSSANDGRVTGRFIISMSE